LSLNYSVSDADDNLDSCWYTLDGGITNVTLVGCANTTFDIVEGSYILVIYANDTFGLSSSDSVSFDVDANGVSVSISEPTGTKTSRIGIDLIYTATGNNLTCWYNVETSVGGAVIASTILVDCNNSIFDVSTDGDFVLNLYVNNSFGSFDNVSFSFSVDTESGGITIVTSGGGGGGGCSRTLDLTPKLDIKQIPDLIVDSGESKNINLLVKNEGLKFLNDCKIKGSGNYASWISSMGVKKLGAGESSEFAFDLSVPESVGTGSYEVALLFECKEIKKDMNFTVEILEKKLELLLTEVIREKDTDNVKIIYSLEELSSLNQNVELQFLLFDSNNEIIAELTEIKDISANSKIDFETSIPFDESLEGNFNLLINLNSESYSSFIQENVFIGSPFSGFVVFNDMKTADNFISLFLIILFAGFSFVMIRRILKHREGHRKSGKKRKK